MLFWIFDLDNTLYQLPNEKMEFSYDILKNDHQLNYLLNSLPCSKIIFTNGTLGHAHTCLNKLRIKQNFINFVARDTINTLKPHPSSYSRCMETSYIKKTDKCVFFDDLPENLIASKNQGWITVLINKRHYVHEDIDFWFPNIYIALNYFLSKIN